ncbi:phytoene/squalene synthase family protein [Nocardia callitridis]|uniref:Phytoene/squalene synthase family protein n=1 Tax=Nocardia callitridis TaxID=648753 RepID=A0ABP9KK19_9NOCA
MNTGATTSAELAVAYRECRQIAATHGRTYFLATRLLAAEHRPAVHALYAFARTVDDLVDHATTHDSIAELDRIDKQLHAALEPCARDGIEPDARSSVLLAVADTIRRYDIALEHFHTFLHSMRMDVPGTVEFRNRYATMGELREYMRGSAAAIGLQLLPVLGTVVPVLEAQPAAAELGEAFQLTNFLRDVAEDLDRDRIYLPADELAAFGVDAALLGHCRRTAATDPRVRNMLRHLIAVNRDGYRRALPGIELLTPRVRPAIHTAAALYADILSRIEAADYQIFATRAVVPGFHRIRTAVTQFAAPRR